MLSQCPQINIYSNTTIKFSNNNIELEDQLRFFDDNSQRVMVYSGVGGDDTSIIAFMNNTAKNGGIMVLETVSEGWNFQTHCSCLFKK